MMEFTINIEDEAGRRFRLKLSRIRLFSPPLKSCFIGWHDGRCFLLKSRDSTGDDTSLFTIYTKKKKSVENEFTIGHFMQTILSQLLFPLFSL